MFRTYKCKLILTAAQSKRIDSWIGTSRLVYNMALEIKSDTYKKTGKSVHKYELMKQLTLLRKDYSWIEDVPIGVLQNSIGKLDKSYNNFFRKDASYPKYLSKKSSKSIEFKLIYGIKDNNINLPKLGWLKTFKDSDILGTPKTAIIKKEITGYFISIYCENIPEKFVSENQAI